MRIFLAGAALIAALVGAAPSYAETGSLRIEGMKNGKLKGDAKGKPDALEVLALDYSLDIPRNASGIASGRRQHSPATFTVRWSAAAPMLFSSTVKNEVLKVVYTGDDSMGKSLHTLTLNNARIVSFKIVDSNGDKETVDPLVRVSFTFQTIEITTTEGNITAVDEVSLQ